MACFDRGLRFSFRNSVSERTDLGSSVSRHSRLEPGGGAATFPAMSTFTEIESAADQLPRTDKLRLMETLWDELSRREEVESLVWHGEALAETERRLVEGREEVLDWRSVKAELSRKQGKYARLASTGC